MNIAILLAAGKGERLRANVEKPLVELEGQPLFSYCLDTFEKHPLIDYIVLVINEELEDIYRSYINEKNYSKVLAIIGGGKTRHQSSKHAVEFLKDFANDNDLIIIHDAYRILLHPDDLTKTILRAKETGATSLCKKVTSSYAIIENDYINCYVDRDKLIEIETPQIFTFKIFMKSLSKAKHKNYSDDASILVDSNIKVSFVCSEHPNIKITNPKDLETCKHLLGR